MPIHDWTRVDAGIFHEFHLDWIYNTKGALNEGILPPDYYALAEQVAGGLHPDVLSLESHPSAAPPAGSNGPSAASAPACVIALATAPPRVRFTAAAELDTYARKRNRIAIRHRSGDRVMAILEIVSPGNKASRSALRSYVQNAVEFLDAGINLLILDLFPPGPRDSQSIHAAIWSEILDDQFRLPPDKPLTLVAYSGGIPKRAYIEPVAVGDTLPDMPLFLEPELYVLVPLEATYQAAWKAVPRRWRDVLEPPRPG
jgi:hypothetical protein